MINVILLLAIGFSIGCYSTFEVLSYNHHLRTKEERDKAIREQDHEQGD